MENNKNESHDLVPVFTETALKNDYINECYDRKRPALLVDYSFRENWASVRCDMLATDGRADSAIEGVGTNYVLNEDAVDRVNEVVDRYSDEEISDTDLSAMQTAYGAEYISFPKMRVEVAKNLADDLAPIIWNEDNWTVPRNRRDLA